MNKTEPDEITEHLQNGDHEIIEAARPKPTAPPSAPRHTYFDYDQVDRDLGLSEPGEPEGDGLRVAAEFLMPIGEFLTRPDDAKSRGALTTAFFYCLKPELFDNATAAAVATSIGYGKATFHKHIASVRERFGLKPLYCKSDKGREVYRRLRAGNRNHFKNGKLERMNRAWRKRQEQPAQPDSVTTATE